jgi:hypothetical protein
MIEDTRELITIVVDVLGIDQCNCWRYQGVRDFEGPSRAWTSLISSMRWSRWLILQKRIGSVERSFSEGSETWMIKFCSTWRIEQVKSCSDDFFLFFERAFWRRSRKKIEDHCYVVAVFAGRRLRRRSPRGTSNGSLGSIWMRLHTNSIINCLFVSAIFSLSNSME